tara:strand:+ start:8357 stop:8560 length:204 start_codon:yes stop_codon:yes gene_type:complete
MVDISVLDFTLLIIVSCCGGVLLSFLFVFCCEPRRLGIIAQKNTLDAAMNHQAVVAIPSAPPQMYLN